MSEKTIKLMPRIIRYFDKTTEDFVGEITLPELPLDKLQILFGVDAKNPMYDSFLITEKEVDFIKNYHDIKFELDRFDYFLDYDS